MKPAGPPRLGEAAVVGLGIHGLGLAGATAFMDLLFRYRDDLPDPVQERDPILLAQAAAEEALAGRGSWDPARCAVFLSLDRAPGGDLELLPRMLQRELGFMGLGGACLGDELGGNRALQAAVRRIQAGVLDGALVGAVQCWPESAGPAEAPEGAFAVFLALRRREAAEKGGDRIWAILGPGPERDRKAIRFDPGHLFSGRGRTVSGLLQVAAGCVMAGHHACYSQEESRWEPFLDRTDGIGFRLEVRTPGGETTHADLWRPFLPGPPPLALLAAPGVYPYAGATLEDLLQRALRDEPGGQGPFRLALLAHGERERRDLLARVPRLLQRGGEGWLDGEVCFSGTPVRGKIACLFAPGGTSYLGMGRDLLLGMPFLPSLVRPPQDLAPADWVYGARPGSCGDPLCECAGSMFLSQVHAAFTRDLLGLRPDLALGLSRGELDALIAYGAWGDPEGEPVLLRRGEVYARLFSCAAEAARDRWRLPEGAEVQWRTWAVYGPVAKVLERAAQEPRAYVSIVFSPVHCLLAGEGEACRRVLAGCKGLTAFPAVGLAEHTPVMAELRAAWLSLHRRPVRPVPGVAFYSNHFGGAYEPTEDRVAEALAGQATAPLDFPAAAWRAWDSGVRVFIEHGPRNVLTSALMRILPRQEGVFLSMDLQGENSLHRALKVAAELWCRGVPVDLARLQAALGQAQDPPWPACSPRPWSAPGPWTGPAGPACARPGAGSWNSWACRRTRKPRLPR